MTEVTQLLMGQVSLPPQHPRAGEDYPLFGYLLDHPTGPILVDTGAGPGHPRIDELFAPVDIDLRQVLGSVGVGVQDVRLIINTHLHFDHTGGNRLFPGVPVVAQRTEWETAQTEGYTVPDWIEFPGVEWRLVDGVVDVVSGVTVMPTPSHTPGHQAVVVRTGHGLEVIAGQALQTCHELEAEQSLEELPASSTESFASVARRIKDLHPDRVWFSHDEQTWPVA